MQVKGPMLDLEVEPDCGLRNEQIEFTLGTPINQVITALQNCSRIVENVELTYSPTDPLSRDVVICLVKDGIRLRFEPNTQLLRLIEVYDLRNITLRHCHKTFSKPGDQADVDKVKDCFGATRPGVYYEKQRLYELTWRGLSFTFLAPKDTSALQTSYVQGTGLGSLHFPNSASPLLERMKIFKGTPSDHVKGTKEHSPSMLKEKELPTVPVSAFCGMCIPISVRSVGDGKRISGLAFSFYAQAADASTNRSSDFLPKLFERIISFGDSTECVLSALGAPSKVFYATGGKMLIHRGEDHERRDGTQPHYFFNYFSLGVDILFDCITNRVRKFVLHSNLPGHFDFGIHARCNFSITFGEQPFTLTSTSKSETFLEAFSGFGEMTTTQPVVLNRSATENPFESTFCYGTSQVIVEVMRNGLIASVTIF